MNITTKLTPCLWFDSQAEDAAEFYTSIFPNSKITKISRYTDAGREVHGRPAGSVMTVAFEIAGLPFTALNGGPIFKFTEAISFQVNCKDQQEIDYYWSKLVEGGGQHSQCGWLKDRFGLSWQVIPENLNELFTDDPAKASRAMQAMLKMTKFDIEALKKA